MTPRDLRNNHTTGNSCRDALPCANMVLKLPRYFYLLMEKPLGSKFGLLAIRLHSATRKHPFPYPQGDRSGLRKPISISNNLSYHRLSSPWVILNWSSNNARFSFNQPNRKRWGAELVDVKHLSNKAFLSWHHH